MKKRRSADNQEHMQGINASMTQSNKKENISLKNICTLLLWYQIHKKISLHSVHCNPQLEWHNKNCFCIQSNEEHLSCRGRTNWVKNFEITLELLFMPESTEITMENLFIRRKMHTRLKIWRNFWNIFSPLEMLVYSNFASTKLLIHNMKSY